MTDYIKVGDELPEDYTDVLFKDYSGASFAGVYFAEDDGTPLFARYVSDDGTAVMVPNVTEWRYD